LRRLVVVSVVLLGLSVSFGEPLAAKGPLLRLSERVIDFGRVEQMDQLTKHIYLRNEGDAPLRILKIESSCGCAVGLASDSTVAPGQEVKFTVTFSTKEYSGPQEKKITIRSNDPAEPSVTIPVRADIHVLLRLSEETVRFDPVRLGGTASRQVKVSADKDAGLEIGGIRGGEEYLTATLKRDSSAQEEVIWVILSIKPDAPPGLFRETLTLTTTKPKSTRTKITVIGSIVSYFEVPGDGRLRINPTPRGKPAQTTIQITCDGSKPYELLGVETGVPYLSGEIIPKGSNKYDLRITLEERSETGMFVQRIAVLTSDPKQPKIFLQVQGHVRG